MTFGYGRCGRSQTMLFLSLFHLLCGVYDGGVSPPRLKANIARFACVLPKQRGSWGRARVVTGWNK